MVDPQGEVFAFSKTWGRNRAANVMHVTRLIFCCGSCAGAASRRLEAAGFILI